MIPTTQKKVKSMSASEKIKILAEEYKLNLNLKVQARVLEMKEDDNAHYIL